MPVASYPITHTEPEAHSAAWLIGYLTALAHEPSDGTNMRPEGITAMDRQAFTEAIAYLERLRSVRSHLPTALGSVIRSKITGITLSRMRAGWTNYNQSVTRTDHDIEQDMDNWTVLFDNTAQGKPPTYGEGIFT